MKRDRWSAVPGVAAALLLGACATPAGHGGGKPTSKRIEEAADIWTFVFWRLQVEP